LFQEKTLMFVKGLSTRHTAVGTFRFGVVYEVDEKNHAVRKHVLPLLEGESPALEKISKAQAEKEMATPTQFTPEATAPDAKATASDLRGAVAKAQKAQKEAEDKADAAETRAEEAEGKLSTLEDELLKAVGERDAAQNSLKDQEDLMATAQQEIVDLKGKLADLEEANK
jgi:chromosome segregation ATPase